MENKINLFDYCIANCSFSKGSQTEQMIALGKELCSEVELVKTLVKTKAFRTDPTLRELCAVVLKQVQPEKEDKITPKAKSTLLGEPER